jgi:hypothetical protein
MHLPRTAGSRGHRIGLDRQFESMLHLADITGNAGNLKSVRM